ncbi:MAG: AMP-binding protein [Prevotella sp.]|nr:AMP-binding protein [Prevotella sp.]
MNVEEFLAEWYNDYDRVLVHTSGSTGEPKPLWVEKHRMEASARITCSFLGLKPGDTALLCMPLDYIAGKMMMVRALTCGLRLICMEPTGRPFCHDNEWSVVDCTHITHSAHCLSYIDNTSSKEKQVRPQVSCLRPSSFDYRFSLVAMVPMQVYNTLQVPEERERLMQASHLIIGGGAIDDVMAQELRTFPNAAWSTYGMTETLSHIALRRLSGPDADEWYVPFDTVSVSTNADGCLVIDAPEVCAEVLETNDRAEIAPDGRRFRIIGRRDNVICSGGLKIQIEEVERALRPHLSFPYMITRCRDAKFGETVVLLMQSENISIVRDICQKVLPQYWQPKHYLPVSAIPMTETGKPARKKAELYVEGIDVLYV